MRVANQRRVRGFRTALIQQGFQASGGAVKEEGFDPRRHSSFYSRNPNFTAEARRRSGHLAIGSSVHLKKRSCLSDDPMARSPDSAFSPRLRVSAVKSIYPVTDHGSSP